MAQVYGGEYDLTQLNGIAKRVYDKLVDLVGNEHIIQKRVPFQARPMVGESIEAAVALSDEHGFTHSAFGDGSVALNQAVAAEYKRIYVTPSNITLKTAIPHDMAVAIKKGEQAFLTLAGPAFTKPMESMRNRLEFLCLYGQRALAEVASQTGSSTTRTFTCTTGAFSPAALKGLKGARLEAWTAETSGTLLNTNADIVVTAADPGLGTIAVSGNSTDLSAIDTELGSSSAFLFYKGTRTKSMIGIDAISTNTGTIWGLDASSIPLMKGNTQSAGSKPLSFDTFQASLIKAGRKGTTSDSYAALGSHATFADLNTDAVAMQFMGDSSKGSVTVGKDALTYRSSVGSIEYLVHPWVKEQEVFCVPFDKLSRIGGTDVTPTVDGAGRLYRHSDDYQGSVGQLYTLQAIFAPEVRDFVKITSITNRNS